MTNQTVNSAKSLDLHLDIPTGRGKATALREALREAIKCGRLVAGDPLPPYRTLALDLGLSRSIVASAYSDLVQEGWLTARQGDGTRVAALPAHIVPLGSHASGLGESNGGGGREIDLRQGVPSPDLFPRRSWARATRQIMARGSNALFLPASSQGLAELRAAIASYVRRTRGVSADPDDVVITAGYADALAMITTVTRHRPHIVESMGLPFHLSIMRRYVTPCEYLTVDENGATPSERTIGHRAVIHLTPAHQFPLGTVLSPERRRLFVSLAQQVNGLIVEDDYDGEFRYDRQSIGALQPLAPQHVAYVGSASKALSPALRVGWIVAPPWLRDSILQLKGVREQHTPALVQATLAELFASGDYDHAVRKSRARYRTRRQELMAALDPDWTRLGMDAGLHLALAHTPEKTAVVMAKLNDQGIAVDTLASFGRTSASPTGLVVGYSRPTESGWPEARDRFVECLRSSN